jgi:hypothetical protein
MKRFVLTGIIGLGCLLPLVGCVVAPPPPGPPGAYAPGPVLAPALVVAPPVVAVGPGYWRWHHGRRFWVRRRGWHRRWR